MSEERLVYQLIREIEKVAWEIPPINPYTPKIIGYTIVLRQILDMNGLNSTDIKLDEVNEVLKLLPVQEKTMLDEIKSGEL